MARKDEERAGNQGINVGGPGNGVAIWNTTKFGKRLINHAVKSNFASREINRFLGRDYQPKWHFWA